MTNNMNYNVELAKVLKSTEKVMRNRTEAIHVLLLLEMSKSENELFKDTFERIHKKTGFSIKAISSQWAIIRHEFPAILTKYPELQLSREAKEILLIKSTAFEKTPYEKSNFWTEDDVNHVLKLMAKFYVPGEAKRKLYQKVANELGNKTAKAIELLWYNRLRNNYLSADITDSEKEKIKKFATPSHIKKATSRSSLSRKEELREINRKVAGEKEKELNRVKSILKSVETNREEKEITEISYGGVACPEFLNKFNIINPEVNEVTDVEEEIIEIKEEELFQDSEYIFRKISDDEYEIVKGIIKINKEFVNKYLETNKTVVIDKDNTMLAKNYL